MMRSIFIYIITAAFFFSCGGDDRISTDLINIPATASSSSTLDVGFASIEFEEYEFDFGTIAAGRRLTFEFKFSNTGEAPLIISNVQSKCGCTIAKNWPKEVVNPGDGGVIEVEFDSTDRTGSLTKTIDVVTNSRPAITKLIIKGNVIGPDFTKQDLE